MALLKVGLVTANNTYQILVRGFNEPNVSRTSHVNRYPFIHCLHHCQSVASAVFSLNFKECPPGYELQEDGTNAMCTCTSTNAKVVTCNGTKISLTVSKIIDESITIILGVHYNNEIKSRVCRVRPGLLWT